MPDLSTDSPGAHTTAGAPASASARARAPAPLLASIANLRDLGGLVSGSGRRIAAGRVFRSSHLGQLAADDGPRLAALGLRTVLDLRGSEERARSAAAWSTAAPWQQGVTFRHLPIEPRSLHDRAALDTGEIAEGEAVALMEGIYRRLVRDHAHVWSGWLHALLDPAAYPVLFHCTAGKDRTGVAAALLQHALGIPLPAIEADYLLSNAYWKAPERTGGWVVLSSVRPAYLHAAIDTMVTGWGSVEGYLEGALGIGAEQRERLAGHLLLPPGTP